MLSKSPKQPKILLTQDEISSCYGAADLRTSESVKRGLTNRRGDPNINDRAFQARSYACELAAAKYLNVPPATGVNQNGQPDLFVRNSIDIKTNKRTDYINPNMCIEPAKLKPDHYYFFVTGSMSNKEFYMVGYVKGKDVPSKGRITDFGNGRSPVWAIHQRNLIPFTGGNVI